MVIRFCKNRNCDIVLNEYNADCSCVFCDKSVKQCNVLDCADKATMKLSIERQETQMRKCQGCMNYSRHLLSQRVR
jgi:hypothetical protein